MKSRTSYFNATAFKKNLTRFAPVWGLYAIALFLGLFLMMDSGASYWLFSNIADCICGMPIINLGYALICAQLLFGDLYNSRMCNMLHALPIRREGWFVTHVVSGLWFSFVPTLMMALAAVCLAPFSSMVGAWQIPLYWLLGANLEFLFFFGVACLSALCVGSRFAQAVVYGILNFAAVLAYWLVDTLYTPMFYGLKTSEEPFLWLTPMVQMVNNRYIDCEQIETFLGLTYEGFERYSYHGEFTVADGWWYLWVCAAVGIGLMALALAIYRKRRLEVAGDFIAIKALEPVFLVVYTLVVGTCFHFVFSEMMGYHNGFIFNFVGILIGWFTGKMLLERQVNVFRKRSFLGCGALIAGFVLTLVVSWLDPFGIESWVPATEQVKSVTVGTGHGTYHQSVITLTEKEDIEKILAIHETALAKRIDETPWETVEAVEQYASPTMESTTAEVIYKEQVSFTLDYELKGGATKTRYYYIYAEDPEGQTLNSYFSSIESVFGVSEEELTPEFLDELVKYASFFNYGPLDDLGDTLDQFTRAEKRELLDAIVADCREGTMAQYYAFRRNDYGYKYDILSVYFDTLPSVDGRHSGREIVLHTGNTHVMQWLKNKGIDVIAELKEQYGEEYGIY